MDPTDSGRLSRRRLLQAGATGIAAASAGCVSSLPPLGSQVEIGRVDGPDPLDGPTYRRWVPAPSNYPDPEFEGAPTVVAPTALEGDPLAAQRSIAYSIILSAADYLGHDFLDNDLAVGIGGTLAVEGPFDRDEMATFLADTGYDPADTDGEIDFYRRPDGDRTLAIGDGIALQGSGEGSREAVEYLLGVAAGRHDRYHEANEEWATFSDRVGLSPGVLFGWGPFASTGDPDHVALSIRHDEQALYFVGQSRFADADAVPQEQIRDQMREVAGDQPGRMEFTADGPSVTAELRIARADLVDEDDPLRMVPNVMWGWETDTDERTITLEHEAGDSFEAQYATIRAGEPTDRQFSDQYDTVVPGDSITVTVPAGEDSINVVLRLGENSTVSLVSTALEGSQ